MSIKTSFNGSFESAIKIILAEEGGYVNDPDDPGGETKYGISARAYPGVDIKNLTLNQAIEIYRTDYWNRILKFDPALSLIALDCAVNQGVSFSNKVLAEIQLLSPLSTQGRIEFFAAQREARYRKNPKFYKYGKGWLSRLSRVEEISIASLNNSTVKLG